MPLVMVRVKQGERGYYDKTPGQEIIRNEGEVFEMDTDHMHNPGRIGQGDAKVISVKLGKGKDAQTLDKALPFWVELAEDAGTITAADLVPKGHLTRHDKDSVI